MLIAVDIGNSSINIGCFAATGLEVQKLSTNPVRTSEEYNLILQDFFAQKHIEKKDISCIISSVVPSLTTVLKNAISIMMPSQESRVLIVDHTMSSGLKMAVREPKDIGADRFANAVGALVIYGAPVAVVDFGTATTITIVDQQANCIGGAIMPGVGLMNDSLEKGTAKLSKILLDAPESALGKDTAHCIVSGLFYGTAGAVERILAEIEHETACSFTVVVTGGYASFLDRGILRNHKVHPYLIMEGLKILYETNRDQ